MTDLESFRLALSDHARRLCPRGQDIDAWITAAIDSGDYSPAELARFVGGSDHGLTLTTGRMRLRLMRAAGAYDERQGDPE